MNLIHEIDKGQMKEEFPHFDVGDTVRQIFTGVVIGVKGRGLRRAFTVRRIVQGEGVERVFPIHSPLVAGLKIKKRGLVRRAKLYYLQHRYGKSARIRERIETSKNAPRKKA